MKQISSTKIFLFFLGIVVVDFVILSWIVNQIGISFQEAKGYFNSSDFVFKLARFSTSWLGENDFALRLPFLLLHLCNLFLLFLICQKYCKKPIDTLICIIVYVLLPGINVISIFVSKSIVVLFIALCICASYLYHQKILLVIFCLIGTFFDVSLSMVFLALFFYALRHKKTPLLFLSLIAFGVNLYWHDLGIHGVPKGYFVETFGRLALLYSPLLFIYYLYALYHCLAKKESSLLLYIGAISILYTLLFSLRQDIDLRTFLPLSVLGLPVMIKNFMHDVRLRLPAFRKRYIRRFYIILLPLFLETSILWGNKFLFAFSNQDHFLEGFYYVKELSNALKERQIYAIDTNERLQMRLRFYGIHSAKAPILKEDKDGEILVQYFGKTIKRYTLIQAKD